jgi:ribose transport system substrate-binding protein
VRVIVSLPDQENEYQLLQAADARTTAGRLGMDVEILDAKSHPIQQVQEIIRAVNSQPRPTAVVMEPVSHDTIDTVARKAASLGVAWVMMNGHLEHLDAVRSAYPDVPISSVDSDQIEIGRVQGKQLRELVPSGGHVLCVHGPQASASARERFEGMRDVVGSTLRLTVVDGQWSEASAEAAVRSWLRLRTWEKAPVHAVAAQDDSMARGARAAIEALPNQRQWSQVKFFGVDGVPAFGQKLVDEGRLHGTVVMPSKSGPALELLDRWLKSGQRPPDKVRLPVRSYP